MQVRRHLFQGKHGGRIVLLSGSRAEVIAALCRCVQVLHTSSAESEGSAFDDHACWGYNPPNDKVGPLHYRHPQLQCMSCTCLTLSTQLAVRCRLL